MTTKKLHIEGMHCSSCAMSIDFDLEDIEGIVDTKTNYVSQETEVVFNEKIITIEEIVAQIKKTGYQVTIPLSS